MTEGRNVLCRRRDGEVTGVHLQDNGSTDQYREQDLPPPDPRRAFDDQALAWDAMDEALGPRTRITATAPRPAGTTKYPHRGVCGPRNRPIFISTAVPCDAKGGGNLDQCSLQTRRLRRLEGELARLARRSQAPRRWRRRGSAFHGGMPVPRYVPTGWRAPEVRAISHE